jgi:hypothetical protein
MGAVSGRHYYRLSDGSLVPSLGSPRDFERPVMHRTCAWCQKDLGDVVLAPADLGSAGRTSHGICDECAGRLLSELPPPQSATPIRPRHSSQGCFTPVMITCLVLTLAALTLLALGFYLGWEAGASWTIYTAVELEAESRQRTGLPPAGSDALLPVDDDDIRSTHP